jgi:serine/threonine-protein kinase
MKVLWEKVNLPPRPPRELAPGLPPALEAIILKALETQPDARYATAQEMAQALKQVGDSTASAPLTNF